MPKIIEKTLMECTSKGSNKFYEVTLYDHDKTYTVIARWGVRKGNHRNRNLWKTEGGQSMEKYKGSYLTMAYREKNKIIQQKQMKGYKFATLSKFEEKKPKKSKKKTLDDTSLERFNNLEF